MIYTTWIQKLHWLKCRPIWDKGFQRYRNTEWLKFLKAEVLCFSSQKVIKNLDLIYICYADLEIKIRLKLSLMCFGPSLIFYLSYKYRLIYWSWYTCISNILWVITITKHWYWSIVKWKFKESHWWKYTKLWYTIMIVKRGYR